MSGKVTNPFLRIMFVFTLFLIETKPRPKKLDILTISYDLKKNIQEAWCTNRKLVREGKCNIAGFSTKFCLGLDMIRHFKSKFGTLILNDYEAEKLGEMLLSIQCSYVGSANIFDSFTTHLPALVTIHDNSGGITDSTSVEHDVRINDKGQSIEETEAENSSTEKEYETSHDIWIIPALAIILVYIIILGFLAHHRVNKLGYLCCKATKLDVLESLTEHSEKKEKDNFTPS